MKPLLTLAEADELARYIATCREISPERRAAAERMLTAPWPVRRERYLREAGRCA